MSSKELRFKLIVFIILVLFLTSAYSYRSYTEQIDIGERVVSLIIKPGSGLNTVMMTLFDKGVIQSKYMFKFPARFRGIETKLIPGRYDFSGLNSCQSVLDRLERGDIFKHKITIPEGNMIWETAALLAKKLNLDSAVIHNLNSDEVFLRQLEIPGLEGYLFPETYYLPWGIDEIATVTELVLMYKDQTKSLWDSAAANNLSQYDVIKMASIIEAETGLVDEREMVSSVYHNRIRRKMKLDADPTIIYGLGGLDRPLYRKDLKKDTPYNTYLHRGLPPTPINSPGLASIKAAIQPGESEYLYFVADNNGQHYFSRTNAEHNRAIQRIKTERN